jgi:hypothetical protein
MSDDPAPTPSSRLHGITEGDYQSWRHHPVTELLLQYMGDFRDALVREAMGQWEAGALTLATEQEARARIVILRELGELPWSAIESFYEEGSQNAA